MFDLQKRINRKTYWVGQLIIIGELLLFGLLLNALPLSGTNNFEPQFDIPLIMISLIILWHYFCLMRQRANDISGEHPLRWFLLAVIVFHFIVGFFPGEKKKNKYGPIPPDYNLFNS
jgi:uncharacterized membrane protein YhaH (DUF805 family)